MEPLDAQAEELRERIARHPADRYPVQHATACFHLGTVLAGADELDEAREALRRADELFGRHLPVEQAKARNALGAVERAAGRHDAAVSLFQDAAVTFTDHGRPLEAGAARFNLGLVERERGDHAAAAAAFRAARELLDPEQVPAAAASVARELGALLLEQGSLEEGRREARASQELARLVGDHAAVGLAANVVGLAELADGRPAEAVEALLTAVAAHPPSIRPEGYVVATANLALAYEGLGRHAHARMAARRALGVDAGGAAVEDQARAVLTRLGDPPGDLARVLDDEPVERWPELVREELERWSRADAATRESEAGAWIAAQAGAAATGERPAGHDGIDLATALVGGLLELPPTPLQTVVEAIFDALTSAGPTTREVFRKQLSRAVVRFHVPQWMRLRTILEQTARARGVEGEWG